MLTYADVTQGEGPIQAQEQQHISPEEYLSGERKGDIRHEYFAGEVFAMAGVSREHNQILTNIVRLLGNQLLKKPCSGVSRILKGSGIPAESVLYSTLFPLAVSSPLFRIQDGPSSKFKMYISS